MAKKRIKSLMPIDTGEWLGNPRINTLSYDMKGIWLIMLCYMWESPTRGIMAHSNGTPFRKGEIQRVLGVDTIGLETLIESGLLAIDDNGAYYSPEMVHKEKISAIRRYAGRKGGEITKVKVFAPKDEQPPTAPTIIEPPPEKQNPTPTSGLALFGSDEITETPPELTTEQKEKAEKKKKYKYAENVTLTKDEYAKLCEEYTEPAVMRMIEILDNYKGQNGKRYKSDYRAILNWVVNRYNDEQIKYGTGNRRYTPTPQKPAGGVANTPGYTTGAVSNAQGASPESGDAPEKGYSERF